MRMSQANQVAAMAHLQNLMQMETLDAGDTPAANEDADQGAQSQESEFGCAKTIAFRRPSRHGTMAAPKRPSSRDQREDDHFHYHDQIHHMQELRMHIADTLERTEEAERNEQAIEKQMHEVRNLSHHVDVLNHDYEKQLSWLQKNSETGIRKQQKTVDHLRQELEAAQEFHSHVPEEKERLQRVFESEVSESK